MLNSFHKALFSSLVIIGASFGASGCKFKDTESNEKQKPVIENLVRATESWGGDLYAYPEGQAQMTLLRITIPAGFRTQVHTHPQPGVAYVVKGLLECVVKADKTLIVGPGDGFATTFGDVPHYCENIGDKDVLVLVAYAGVETQPVTISLE